MSHDPSPTPSARALDPLWRLGFRTAHRILCCWWWLRRPAGSGAAVAVWHDGRLLLVRTSYRPELDLPGGGVDRGESFLDAAHRELAEEVGLTPPATALHEAVRLGFTLERRAITAAVHEWHPATPPTPRIDRREIVWAGWLDPDDLAPARLTTLVAGYLAWRAGMAQGHQGITVPGHGRITTHPDRPAPRHPDTA